MKKVQKQDTTAFRHALGQFAVTAPERYMPGISIDTVIFGYHEGKLKVLLQHLIYATSFSLPGGYLPKNQALDQAALQILQERTGLTNLSLEQFYTSGETRRSNKQVFNEFAAELFNELPEDNWFAQRFISVCYFALVDFTEVTLASNTIYTELKWYDVKRIPRLLFDHNLIIEKALLRLQSDLDQIIPASSILGESFTIADLQKLYEAVHQKEFVRTNFQRKMLAMQVLDRLEKKYTGKSHKAPYLYRFRVD